MERDEGDPSQTDTNKRAPYHGDHLLYLAALVCTKHHQITREFLTESFIMSSCPVLQCDEALFKHVNKYSTIKGKVNPTKLCH